jgi:ATP-dependent DNA ligase
MEPKIDGWRMQMDVTPDHVTAWTRTQHDASGKMPKVEAQLKYLAHVGNTTFRLDGEAVYVDPQGRPDYNFTARCLGSGLDTCIDKQREENRWLTFFVFDILKEGDNDLRVQALHRRKTVMKEMLNYTGNVELVLGNEPTYDQHEENFKTFLEGSVLKLVTAPYAGKRHKSWLKWKQIETLDVTVIGYKEGQGKYKGLIGAIEFRAPDGTRGFCSGMDDDTRVNISDHRENYRGTIIEIKHYGRLVDGFRHPQFLRFRPDKGHV